MGHKTFAIVLIAGLCTSAWAGDIEGKVSGMKGQSVVYVDVVAGKTFPAPKEHPIMDQKGLLFAPHIMVVQQGTTVEFLNLPSTPKDPPSDPEGCPPSGSLSFWLSSSLSRDDVPTMTVNSPGSTT